MPESLRGLVVSFSLQSFDLLRRKSASGCALDWVQQHISKYTDGISIAVLDSLVYNYMRLQRQVADIQPA